MTAPYISPLAQSGQRRRLGGGAGTYTQGPAGLSPLQYGGQPPDPNQPQQPRPYRAPASAGASSSPGAPQAPAPTFAEMQAQGRARPAPPPGYGAYGGATSGYGGSAPGGAPAQDPQVSAATRQAVLQMLGQPSTYGSDAVQRSIQLAGQNIDDKYKLDTQNVDEEMARRGIYDSTIAGGRLHDLNATKKTAMEAIAEQEIERQAQTESTDRANALSAALGYQQQQSGQALDWAQLAQQGSQFGQTLSEQGRQFDTSNALSSELGRGNLQLGRDTLTADTSKSDKDRALASTLGLGNLDVSRQNAATQAQGVGNQYDLGLKNFGLDQSKLGEDARQFDATNSLAQVSTLGGLDLQRAGLLQNDAQFGASLAQRANEFGATDFRQSQTLGLQDNAQRIALGQTQAQILAQIASMPGFSSLPDAQKAQIMSALQQVGPPGASQITGNNPYLTAQYGTTSIYQPLGYQSPLQGWNPNYAGLLGGGGGSGSSGYTPFQPYTPPAAPAGGTNTGGLAPRPYTPTPYPTSGGGVAGGVLGSGGTLGNGGALGGPGLPGGLASFSAAPMPPAGGASNAYGGGYGGSGGAYPPATGAPSAPNAQAGGGPLAALLGILPGMLAGETQSPLYGQTAADATANPHEYTNAGYQADPQHGTYGATVQQNVQQLSRDLGLKGVPNAGDTSWVQSDYGAYARAHPDNPAGYYKQFELGSQLAGGGGGGSEWITQGARGPVAALWGRLGLDAQGRPTGNGPDTLPFDPNDSANGDIAAAGFVYDPYSGQWVSRARNTQINQQVAQGMQPYLHAPGGQTQQYDQSWIDSIRKQILDQMNGGPAQHPLDPSVSNYTWANVVR